ncbi:MAG: hypothetical protein AB1758_32170, partial [Candidatus Eremiobacterota bacterium]
MKFKTFLKLVILGGVLLAVGACYGLSRWMAASPRREAPPEPAPVRATQRTSVASASPPGGLSPLERKILGKAGQKIESDKIKDAFPGSVKVNLYQDDPAVGINRAKVDLDRDDKWDEKWTFDAQGGVKREVSPHEDEQYTEVYLLSGDRWVAEGATPEPVASAQPPTRAGAMRPFDQGVVDRAGQKISGDKVKDAIPGSVKVNLYQDDPA